MNILGNFSVNPFSCRPTSRAKDHLPREVHVHFRRAKESTAKEFKACTEPCLMACLIRQSLNYLYSLFGSEIYVLLNEKRKVYKGPIRSAMY